MTGSASATILSTCTNRLRRREYHEPRGEAAPQAVAFERLPNAERRQSDCQIARPLQQRKCEPHLGCQSEGAAEQYIGSLLDANRVGYRKGNGADRVEQALDHQYYGEVEGSAGEAECHPNFERARHPTGKVKKEAAAYAGSTTMDMPELDVNRGGAGGGAICPAAPECASETIKQVEAVALDDHERDRDQPGRGYPRCDRKCRSRSGPQTKQQKEAK